MLGDVLSMVYPVESGRVWIDDKALSDEGLGDAVVVQLADVPRVRADEALGHRGQVLLRHQLIKDVHNDAT